MAEVVTEPRVRAKRWVAMAAVVFVCNQIGIALTAQLVTHAPLALMALSPLGRNFLLASQVTPLIPFTLVGVGRRALASLIAYKLGAAYGQQAIGLMEARMPRLGRLVRMFERLFHRADVAVSFFVPRGSALVAGSAGMDLRVFMLASIAGHTFWVVITYLIGDWLSEYIQPVLAFIQENMRKVTAFFIALAALQVVVHRMRNRGGATPPT